MRIGLQRVGGWAETGFYLVGVALLCAFFAIRLEANEQREEGIQAFHQAAALGAARLPDQHLWSEQRIRAHAASGAAQAGTPLAIMTIGRLGIEVPVYDGADELNLDRGAARIEGTARIDEPGNIGIAGHRDGFFRGLKDIAIGDRIELLTADGEVTYTVWSIDIVDPADVWVLEPTASRTVTLVTCYPFYFVGSAPKRFIVKAEAQVL